MSSSLSSASVLRDTVEQRLDTINILAEALAAAIRDGDRPKESELRASLGRFVSAFRWNAGACVPAVRAYADARDDGDDDLLAPAFILASVAPDGADTAKVTARLSEDARLLVGSLRSGS